LPLSNWKDPRLSPIRALRQRKERERTGLFFAEGVKFLSEAAAANAKIQTLVVAPQMLNNAWSQKTVRHLKRAGVEVIEVTPDVFQSLSLADEPQGVGMVVRQRWHPLEKVGRDGGLCWLAFETVRSPGNLGTILRTSDAVGGSGVILIGETIDPFDPALVRATMGAVFSQRFVRATHAEFARWKQRSEIRLIGTSPSARRDYRAACYHAPLVLYMGSERKGMPPEQQALCDEMVRIPVRGRADSLNLAVATGVMLYEVLRQKDRGPRTKDGKVNA
jgi:RNA methyltransferase, TrmH family